MAMNNDDGAIRGLIDNLNVATVLVIAVAFGAGAMFAPGLLGDDTPEEQASITGDFDGDFQTFQPIQELTGYNDLSVTEQTLNSTGEVDDANVHTKFDINESNGDVLRFAYGFELGGPVEAMDVEMVNEGVDSNLDVREVKIVRDEDDETSLDEARSVAQIEVDDSDEVDQEIARSLEGGDYAVVMEVRGIDTNPINNDQDLYTLNLDADTDADSDEAEEMHVTIDNAQ